MKRYIQTTLVVSLIAYFVLFFDIDIKHQRILHQLWNLGHVFLFLLISFYLYKKIFNRLTIPLYLEIFYITIFSIFIGSSIEYIQYFTGRDKSYYDVALDVVGGLLGVAIFSTAVKNTRKITKIMIRGSIFFASIIIVYPMFVIVLDDINQKIEFPILFSNMHSRELSRITKENINIESINNALKDSRNGKLAKLTFLPGLYSTGVFATGIQDWSEYKDLNILLYNPRFQVTSVSIRIHDNEHSSFGNLYNDRYNQRSVLTAGWNEIVISLEHVKNAPFERKMDMKKIDQLILYKNGLKAPEILYLGTIRLAK